MTLEIQKDENGKSYEECPVTVDVARKRAEEGFVIKELNGFVSVSKRRLIIEDHVKAGYKLAEYKYEGRSAEVVAVVDLFGLYAFKKSLALVFILLRLQLSSP